ncbi:MAG: nucleotidyltransferase family protein [Oceanospirillaceae bacterium]
MKAMILAAGRGSRLKELTEKTPKPLVRILNKPLIEYHLDNLQQAGFTDVVINISWLADQLEEYLNNQYEGSLSITIYREEQALETGGGVLAALNDLSCDNSPFLVINADVMTDFDYANIIKEMDTLAHLYLVKNPAQHKEGDFCLGIDGILMSKQTKGSESYTFSGISVLTPQLFADCNAGIFSLAVLFAEYAAKGMISAELLSNNWFDVGTLERLKLASAWQRELQASELNTGN